MKVFLTFISILISCMSINGQRVSEADVAIEASFIAANQKKIIGKYDEAVKIYLKIIEQDPVNAVVWHDLARVYHSSEKIDEAIKSAQKAVRYAPDNTWFKLTLAQFQVENLEFQAAGKNFGEIARKTGDRDIYQRWARALIDGQKYPAAIQVMNKMDARFGKNESRSDDKIELYLAMEDKKSAIDELNSWIEANPNDIYYLTKLGKFYSFVDDKKKAIKAFEKVLDREPKNGDAMLALQQLKGNKGGGKNDKISSLIYSPSVSTDIKVKALMPIVMSAEAEEVENILPLTNYLATTYTDHPQSQALNADALYLTGDLVQAQEFYIRTLALEKSNYQVWDQLLSIYEISGDQNQLFDLAEEALDYFPNQGGPYYYLAKASYFQTDYKEAKEMLSEASIIGGSNKLLQSKIGALNAYILDAEGSTNKAITMLESMGSQDPVISEMIGDFYLKINNKEKASEAFSKAMKQGGDKERIKQKIQSI